MERDISENMWHYEMTQSQHYNNENKYNDDNMMRTEFVFEFFAGLF